MRVNRLKIQRRWDGVGLVFKDDNYPHEEDNAYSLTRDQLFVPYLREQLKWMITNPNFKTIGYYANW
jgi:hypothetical protein